MESYKPAPRRLARHARKGAGRNVSSRNPVDSRRCYRKIHPAQRAAWTVGFLAVTSLAYLHWCFVAARHSSAQQRERASVPATTTYGDQSQRMLDFVEHITAPEAHTSGSGRGGSGTAQAAENHHQRRSPTGWYQESRSGAEDFSTNEVEELQYNDPSTELDTRWTAAGLPVAAEGVSHEDAGAPADRDGLSITANSRRNVPLPERGEEGRRVKSSRDRGRSVSSTAEQPLADTHIWHNNAVVADVAESAHLSGTERGSNTPDVTTLQGEFISDGGPGADAAKYDRFDRSVALGLRHVGKGGEAHGTEASLQRAASGDDQMGYSETGSEPEGVLSAGAAVGGRGPVPEWGRPSGAELEDIVRAQFGKWRTLSDAIDRSASNTTEQRQQQQQQQQQADMSNSNRGRHGIWGLFTGRQKAKNTATQPQPPCAPMQQGMDPYLESNLRPCYDKMRENYDFGEPLRQVEIVTVGEDRPVKEAPHGVVTFMSTSRDADVRQLTKALKKLSANFLERFRYPVAIIHEDFTPKLMEHLSDLVPVPVHFVKVVFKLPGWMEPLSWIYPLAVRHYTGHPKSEPVKGYHSDMHGILPYVKRASFGYFHMCRFFGGAGFMLPFFEGFEFYLRLDSDSVCDKPLPDYFSMLQDADADYAFDSTFVDFGDKAQGLWNFAERYIADNGISPTFWDSPNGAGKPFKALAKAWKRPPYPTCSQQPAGEEDVVSARGAKIHAVPCRDRHFQAVPAFYTNFEVARIQMLRSSWYQDWFNAVDRTGSIYYNRWGDAPLRFIGLSMHLPAQKIMRVNGCRHG